MHILLDLHRNNKKALYCIRMALTWFIVDCICVENWVYLHISIVFLFVLTSSATSDFTSLETDFASSQWL